MPFTTKEFPNKVFSSMDEYQEALRKSSQLEKEIAQNAQATKVTATLIPASKEAVERRIATLEAKLDGLSSRLNNMKKIVEPEDRAGNKEGLPIGAILQGESKGRVYTLEILEESYLCSDGSIYHSLSGAALGVSGNRRSGWKFWKDSRGTPIGELTGRFKSDGVRSMGSYLS